MYLGPRHVEWRETPEPVLTGDADAIVRPLAVATCDLDDSIVTGVSPFAAPFVLGHEGVAEVIEVGDGVTSVRPGDVVVIPFQISCGGCVACVQGRTGNCGAVPLAATYGFGFGAENTRWGGFLADLIRVPFADAMLLPVPAGLDVEVAAGASDNIVDAYRTVGPHLERWPGAPVLVIGGISPGSVGVYAAGLAVALGSSRVLYLDPDPGRRALVESFGGETLDRIPENVGRRFPIAVANTDDIKDIEFALGSLGRDGVCTATNVFFQGVVSTKLPLLSMYTLGASFITGRIHARRDAPRVLELLADGTFDPRPATTRVVPFAGAADALLEGHYTKLIFAR